MRSKYILGVLGTGLVIAAAGGCGSDAEDGNTGGTGGTGASGSASSTGVGAQTTSTTTGTATGPTSSSSSGKPDTNVDCASGVKLDIGTAAQEELENPETDEDFFTFEGTKGQAVFLLLDAKPDDDPFADGYVDSVLTVYGPDGSQYAENDDPIPRNTQDSSLYTVLPADGTYCIKVQDFCKWAADKGDPCPASAVPVDDGNFAVLVGNVDPTAESVTEHDETADGDPPYTVMKYGPNTTSGIGYYASEAYGVFDMQSEVDTFTFTIPEDIICDAQNATLCSTVAASFEERTTGNVELFPAGTDGNGSTVPVGDVWITPAGSAEIIAKIDGTKIDPTFGLSLNTPLSLGTPYELHVKAQNGAAVGANPFYFLLHYGAGSNPLDQEDNTTTPVLNDSINTAMALEPAALASGATGFFVAGTVATPADVDFFSFDNAAAAATDVIRAVCSGQRSGSGLTGLQFTVHDDKGKVIGTSAVESADAEADLSDAGIPVPAADASIFFIQVKATGVLSDVTSRYYQCGINFGDPAP
ncbi:MAG: hypothetical protein WKG00_06870 [Polyangiaceae bacterium]